NQRAGEGDRPARCGGRGGGARGHRDGVERERVNCARERKPRRGIARVGGQGMCCHTRRADAIPAVMGRASKAPPVTVRTVAAHVGVSAAAVSTVLANRYKERRLAPATVEKIRQAVRDLGYVPNIAGRRLRAHDPGVRQIDLGILTSYEAPLFLVSRSLRQVQRMVDARTTPQRRYSVA